jgi:hypothetical protein
VQDDAALEPVSMTQLESSLPRGLCVTRKGGFPTSNRASKSRVASRMGTGREDPLHSLPGCLPPFTGATTIGDES